VTKLLDYYDGREKQEKKIIRLGADLAWNILNVRGGEDEKVEKKKYNNENVRLITE